MSLKQDVSLEPAWVLHHRSFRDSSEILDLFTRDHGRVGVVARGVRRVARRSRIVPAPFQPLIVSWRGRGELFTLTTVEPGGPALPASGSRLMSMFYANELLLRLLQRLDPHPGLYESYVATLTAIARREPEDVALRCFEKDLLDEIGYGLNLVADAVSGEPIEAAASYEYVLEQGPRKLARTRTGPLILEGGSLLALESGDLATEQARKDAKRLLGAALKLYLGDRPIQTRKVLQEMKGCI